MRMLASALVALAVGCGGAVPLDSDGGGTAPSSCAATIDNATDRSARLGVRVAGTRTLTGATDLYCHPDVANGTRYTCTLDGIASAASLALVVTLRGPLPTGASAALLGQAFAFDRVTAEGGTDTSAWGGALRLWNPTPAATGIDADLGAADTSTMYGTACSAAGSALTVRGFVRAHLCTNPDCR